jgi:hypothetical protein
VKRGVDEIQSVLTIARVRATIKMSTTSLRLYPIRAVIGGYHKVQEYVTSGLNICTVQLIAVHGYSAGWVQTTNKHALPTDYSQTIAQSIGSGTRRVVVKGTAGDHDISGRVQLGSEEKVV